MLRLFDLSGLLLFLMGLGFLLGAAATGSSMAGILWQSTEHKTSIDSVKLETLNIETKNDEKQRYKHRNAVLGNLLTHP